jgi:hypothetical protein
MEEMEEGTDAILTGERASPSSPRKKNQASSIIGKGIKNGTSSSLHLAFLKSTFAIASNRQNTSQKNQNRTK